ncbi:MAG: nuclear transport factor 2 family protein [Burkholderiaceae bacterium]
MNRPDATANEHARNRPTASDDLDAGASTDAPGRLLDREAIRDCLYRYCRGIDRADEASLRDSYWPDAHDSHGATSGPIEIFFERVRAAFARGPRNVHRITNILIEFAGPDTAIVESCFDALQRGPGPDGITRQFHLAGRYCDRFEKRAGHWRVARRVVVYDWVDEQTAASDDERTRFGVRQPVGEAWPHDTIYRLLAEARQDTGAAD